MAGQASPTDGNLPPEEALYGWNKLNQMVDEFALERLQIFREERVGPFTVTAGMGDVTGGGTNIPAPITIGVGATWNTPRPIWIDRFGIIYTAGGVPQPELGGHVFQTKEWGRITVKGVTSTLSRSLYYDRTFDANGYGNIYLYPVPSASFKTVLYVPVAVAEFPVDVNGNPDFSVVISLPPGYRSMLISNLAVIMSIGVSTVGEDLKEHAINSRSKIAAGNVVTHMDALMCEEAVTGSEGVTSSFDWLTGEIN